MHNYIFLVYDDMYESQEVVLATINLEKAIDKAISTKDLLYLQVWENEKLIYEYYGEEKEEDNTKENIYNILKQDKIIDYNIYLD